MMTVTVFPIICSEAIDPRVGNAVVRDLKPLLSPLFRYQCPQPTEKSCSPRNRPSPRTAKRHCIIVTSLPSVRGNCLLLAHALRETRAIFSCTRCITSVYFAISFQLVAQASRGNGTRRPPVSSSFVRAGGQLAAGLPGRDFNPGRMTEPHSFTPPSRRRPTSFLQPRIKPGEPTVLIFG
jgi:hypothetical protein